MTLDGRDAVIVTMHGKERAIAPVLRYRFHMNVRSIPMDTDRFGTFTGETPREGSQEETLRRKLYTGVVYGEPHEIVIASEGSFFPDPALPFLTLDRELIGLHDPRADLIVIGAHLTADTNVTSVAPETDADLEKAATAIGLPDHGAVIRAGAEIHKGIISVDDMVSLARAAWRRNEPVIIESDMRAHMNPTRMRAIAQAAENLADRLESRCPACARPGFWQTSADRGLPCEHCSSPTDLIAGERWGCTGCGFEQERRREGRANPRHCEFCNP